MKINIVVLESFEKNLKRLLKKYPSLKLEISELASDIYNNPFLGTSLGNGFYKIRLSIKSKGKGKSGGARVISYVKIIKEIVFVTAIYDKSEQEEIGDEELLILLKEIGFLSTPPPIQTPVSYCRDLP